MLKLAVFDLDCTLAQHGKGILQEDIVLLRRLEQKGVRIAIASGKPVYYLCGMLRQVGLKAPILIGEVGASIQYGVDLPPQVHFLLGESQAVTPLLMKIKKSIQSAIPDMWFQPNEVNLSVFPKNEKEFAIIKDIIQAQQEALEAVNIYYYSDAIDFVPKGIDKGAALRFLAKKLQIESAEIAAVGDSSNDYPMFEVAGLSIGIRLEDESKADNCVADCHAAIELLLENTF